MIAQIRLACNQPRCRNRARKKGGGECSKCHQRAWRAGHPMRAAYANLRDHAKIPRPLGILRTDRQCRRQPDDAMRMRAGFAWRVAA